MDTDSITLKIVILPLDSFAISIAFSSALSPVFVPA